MNSFVLCPSFKMLLFPFCLIACLIVFYIPVNAQENPPKPFTVTVRTLQFLNFGTFCNSSSLSSGTVTMIDGVRGYTGGVVLIYSGSNTPSEAIFDIEAIENSLITIINGPDVSLGGSNTGSLNLHLGKSDRGPSGSSFIATGTPFGNDKMVRLMVKIGGTLTVGPVSANPPGFYSGTFLVTFIQQ